MLYQPLVYEMDFTFLLRQIWSEKVHIGIE